MNKRVLVQQAKEIARQWVRQEAESIPHFCGAFHHGSLNWLPDDALVPPTSDVDIMVVLDTDLLPNKPGKFVYEGVLLEVSYITLASLQTPELILGSYHLAGSFRKPSVIFETSDRLVRLNTAVSRDYAKRVWVRRRCENARDKILSGSLPPETASFPDQVNAWLFPAGITTHVLLTAGLKNPTVRRRHAAVRELLNEYQHLEFQETLLELLGCQSLSRRAVEAHLEALTGAFDAAADRVRTPFFFASDISPLARPLAIDGSRELIEQGLHREAIFWIVATYTRCQKIFLQDTTPEIQKHFESGYRKLLGDLGIISISDLQRRREHTFALLPRVWEIAETILASNPEIED